MTVKELIKELEKYNDTTEVSIFIESEKSFDYGKIENLTYTPDDEIEMISGFVTINCVAE